MVEEAKHLKVEKPEEEAIGVVQGIVPDSKNEWYVALALEKLKIEYWYQYPIFGGHTVRGGQVVDFVVFCPMAVPVFVQGAYWHGTRSEGEDILKQQAAYSRFHHVPILLTEEETKNKENAYQAVMNKVKV